jgi:hypothetical protein
MHALLAAVLLNAVPPQDAQKPPKVEVVFVLDTTGSMSGLIDAAKRKIWSIANELLKATPKPELKVGLVAYRDRGDAYVTKVVPLTLDLDRIHEELSGLRAQGGGDGPEDVRSALRDAITKIEWTPGRGAFKAIFLVGDAPPHLDYADVPTIEELCVSAVKAELLINTVRCGGDGETERIWRSIASRAEGTFVSIAQDGAAASIATPFDGELGALSDRLGGTVLAYGSADKRRALEAAEARNAAPAPASAPAAAVKADRASAKVNALCHSEDDLVDAVRDGRAKLEDLKDEQLPESFRKLDPAARRAKLEELSKARAEIRAKIAELAKKRDAWLAEEARKAPDGFDGAVNSALRAQGAKHGLHFSK